MIEELDLEEPRVHDEEKHTLIPRTPQPRKRKVSVFDLVKALEKALEVKQRRVMNSIPPMDVKIPAKKKDISLIIKEVYTRVLSLLTSSRQDRIKFSQLLKSDTKEDKIYTFIPLLHLTTQRKVNLEQKEHFGEIEIMLNTEKVDKEIDAES